MSSSGMIYLSNNFFSFKVLVLLLLDGEQFSCSDLHMYLERNSRGHTLIDKIGK